MKHIPRRSSNSLLSQSPPGYALRHEHKGRDITENTSHYNSRVCVWDGGGGEHVAPPQHELQTVWFVSVECGKSLGIVVSSVVGKMRPAARV